MNVRIKSNFTIFSNIFYNDHLQANRYEISVEFLTKSENPDHYNIAIDRAVYFIQAVCDNAIFVDENTIFVYPEIDNMGCDVVVLPEEPSDQIIGLMLYCKLNAIMEGVIQVTDVAIKSHVGGEYEYLHNENELIGPFEEEGWWHESVASIRDSEQLTEEQQEVYFETLPKWEILGLDWDKSYLDSDIKDTEQPKTNRKQSTNKNGEVVFVDFGKNPDKSDK